MPTAPIFVSGMFAECREQEIWPFVYTFGKGESFAGSNAPESDLFRLRRIDTNEVSGLL